MSSGLLGGVDCAETGQDGSVECGDVVEGASSGSLLLGDGVMSLVVGGDCIVLVAVLWSGGVEVGAVVVGVASEVRGVVEGDVVSSGRLSVRELFCVVLVRFTWIGVFCSDAVRDMSEVEGVSEEELSSVMP